MTDEIDSTSLPAAWICRHWLSFWMRSVRALVSASFSCVSRATTMFWLLSSAPASCFSRYCASASSLCCTRRPWRSTSPLSHSALFSRVWTFSDRFSDTYSSAYVLTARAANTGSGPS